MSAYGACVGGAIGWCEGPEVAHQVVFGQLGKYQLASISFQFDVMSALYCTRRVVVGFGFEVTSAASCCYHHCHDRLSQTHRGDR